MTSNVNLLPLPEKVEVDKHLPTGVRIYAYDKNTLKDYARANVEHHTAAHAAEIEALRAEVGELHMHANQRDQYAVEKAAQALDWKKRAERLAEALLNILPFVEHSDSCGDRDAYNLAEVRTCDCGLDGIREHADALLDHEQEVGNWTCEMRPNTHVQP